MVCIRGKQWKGLGAALGVSRLRNRQGKGKLRSYFYYYRVQIVPIFFYDRVSAKCTKYAIVNLWIFFLPKADDT